MERWRTSLVVFCAVFGPSIAPYSPYKIKVSERFMPPTPMALFDGGDGKHAAFSHIFGPAMGHAISVYLYLAEKEHGPVGAELRAGDDAGNSQLLEVM